ncbi:energy transducer TonB [Flavobacterium sp. RHBU_24]|uniref:energy transducer TonB n=1 Tax=Flavobacterium sp. RHBU_24 TaxID=3391185 RepID=UPI0039855EF3
MEHNDIDKYFKERAPQFDEQPGDALWAKIESGLDTPVPKQGGESGYALNKWVWILSGLVVTVVATAFIFINYFGSESDSWLNTPKPEILHEGDKVSTATEGIWEQPVDTVKPKILAKKPAIAAKETNNGVASRKIAPNPTEDTLPNGLMRDVNVAAPKPTPEHRKIKISVQESEKRTVIILREKVSQQKFDSIVAASQNQYKDKSGMQLIVKGFNGMIHRSTITQTGGEVESTRDSITTQPKSKRAVTAKMITTKDSIRNESAEFVPRYDSVTDTYYVQYENRDRAINEPVYTAQLTVQPEFPGGISEFFRFVDNNFEYPESANQSPAKIYVSFIIETDGNISNIKVLKDPGNGLGGEAIRVLKLLTTKWKPGEVKGQVVRTAYFIPLTVYIKL